MISLRDVSKDDLAVLFDQQRDAEANEVAVANPRDRASFDAHWAKILTDTDVVAKVIVDGDLVLGQISCFSHEGKASVGYWIGREHWGTGVVTRALALLLDEVSLRPLHARVARTNVASLRALQRHGFKVTGYEHAPATERFPACDEAILVLAR